MYLLRCHSTKHGMFLEVHLSSPSSYEKDIHIYLQCMQLTGMA